MDLPRPEYPRPQFVRKDWLCLNGQWQFEIDAGDSGLERGLKDRDLERTIMVPFCPESELSGIGYTDFMLAVWYRKTVAIPTLWGDKRVLLHFQACDYDTTVWVNGIEVARHRGGFTPFTADLSIVPGIKGGERVTIVVRARDDWRGPQPRGKQSERPQNYGCKYIRTTGIWQSVWMEPVSKDVYLKRPRITPDVANNTFRLECPISNNRDGYKLRATLALPGKNQGQNAVGFGEKIALGQCRADADLAPRLDLVIPKEHLRLWSIEDPFLYDIVIGLYDAEGNLLDEARSYAGLRGVTIDGQAIKINGKKVFQRLVLDQGYYPDGILTAPSDAALKRDIELGIEAGFNGARLHQKVFEERFLYHCDKLGYIVWGEFADWGSAPFGPPSDHQKQTASFITEWLEAVERDYNHPSIVGWCPLNETRQQLHDRIVSLDDVTRGMYLATKALDTTRPVVDASGYSHRVRETDVYDSHDYEQNPEKFTQTHAGLAEGKPLINPNQGPNQKTEDAWSFPYNGQPYFVSEFGGIWWNPEAKKDEYSWGYGDRPKSEEEFYARFEGLCAALLNDKHMFGYCYTQLTDVYQEQNGIYHFDRRVKLDMKRIRAAQTKKAAIEN